MSGTGSAKTLAKIANSKAGRFTIDIVQTMTNNVISKFEKGQIESFSDLDLQEEFIFASFQTLLAKGLGKRSDELLESLKGKNVTLYNRMAKYKRNESLGKDGARLKSDKHKVEVAKGESAKTTAKYVSKSTKAKGTAGVGTSALRNENDKRKNK